MIHSLYDQIRESVRLTPGQSRQLDELAISAVEYQRIPRICPSVAAVAGAALAVASVAAIPLYIHQSSSPDDASATASNSSNASEPRTGSDEQWQMDVRDEASRVTAAAQQSGLFVGSRYDNNAREYIVFGSGPEPASVTEVIKAVSDSLVVTWRAVSYTATELTDSQSVLINEYPAVVLVEQRADYGGLIAYVKTEEEVAALRAALTSDRQVIVPVTIRVGGAVPLGLPK